MTALNMCARASSRTAATRVILPAVNLRELGARVHLYDATGDDVGVAHLPRSVEPGDIAAREHGPPSRTVALVDVEPGGPVDVLSRSNRCECG
jgi:hypothetical protein